MNLFLSTREHLKITIFFDSSIAQIGLIDDFIINNQMKEKARRYIERGSWFSIFKEGEYFSYEAIRMYIVLLKKVYEIDYDTFNEKYEGYTGTYCIQIYQMLKYIDNSQIHDKQFYVNLFRAQFTKEELEFLFYHCLGSIGERKFKPLVEKYEFFEHLVLNDDIEPKLIRYSEKAFGKNEMILTKQEELKEAAALADY